MNKIIILIIFVPIFIIFCVEDKESVTDSIITSNNNNSATKNSIITFIDVTEQAGLLEPLKGIKGHSAAVGDFNGDGLPDLFVGTFSDRSWESYNVRGNLTGPEPDKLFINIEGNSFIEITDTPVNVFGRSSGSAFADFDNDGDLDLVVSHNKTGVNEYNSKGVYIFRNNGNNNFEDVTALSQLVVLNTAEVFNARNTFVFDYDGDGLLDILFQEDHVRSVSGDRSRLMHNEGDFTFTDTTVSAGISEILFGLGGFVGDINGDSWPDIYFAHSDILYINSKDGKFIEKRNYLLPLEYSLPEPENHNWPCSANIGDLDNDGDMDIVIGEHFPDAQKHRIFVFLNSGNDMEGFPIYKEITEQAGIKYSQNKEPNIQIEDLNNDGWMDIVTSSQDTFIYQNLGVIDGIPVFANPIPTIYIEESRGHWTAGCVFDYNRDGRLDIFLAEWEANAPSILLKNVTEANNNFINISINIPDTRNIFGVGATVKIFKPGESGNPDALLGIKLISVSNGYSSGSEAIAHFGIQKYNFVDIVVYMPSEGNVYIVDNVSANQFYIIRSN